MAFILTAFFHGAFIIGLFIFLIIVSIFTFIDLIKLIKKNKIKISLLFFLVFSRFQLLQFIQKKIKSASIILVISKIFQILINYQK